MKTAKIKILATLNKGRKGSSAIFMLSAPDDVFMLHAGKSNR